MIIVVRIVEIDRGPVDSALIENITELAAALFLRFVSFTGIIVLSGALVELLDVGTVISALLG